jgi:hypothetical protein
MRLSIAVCIVAFLWFVASARAEVVGELNWADDVVGYSDSIQNYGGTVLSEATTWWLTGPSDASATDDYAAGWRTTTPDDYIIMHWETPLVDGEDEDLVIRLFSGPKASGTVLASVDGVDYTQVGVVGGGTPSIFREECFDFGGAFAQGVSYVKVCRDATGPQTGVFFDSFAGEVVAERVPGDANLDDRVDAKDAARLAEYWGWNNADWGMGDFNGDDTVGVADAAILAANWGFGVGESESVVPEPSILMMSMAIFVSYCWLHHARGTRRVPGSPGSE